MDTTQQKMNIVIVGHVDHGKSTVIGRLLADTNSLPQGKLEQVRADCKRNAKPFEYAFLLDALKDEQAQGITIDTARCFFKSNKREYIIIDAPGHIEFLKNMVSGAARAEAALLIIDANEGIKENSKRHGYLLSMLGIRQVAICVNKMDLVGYKQSVFEQIEHDYRVFLKDIGLEPRFFVPVAAREGDNITGPSERLAWYSGHSILSVLDAFEKAPSIEASPLRMPVQAVYKFTEEGDDRRIVAGRVESGSLSVGDEVVFLPSNKRSTVKSIEVFNAPAQKQVRAGYSTGVTLAEQVYINRGELMCKAAETQPQVSTLLRVELFWMGQRPMVFNRVYKLKIGTVSVPVKLKSIERVIDASDLKRSEKSEIGRHDVAQCVLETTNPVAYDLAAELEATGRFVIVDAYLIAGGGIIAEEIKDSQAAVREHVARRELNWDASIVAPEDRQRIYGHKPAFVVLAGSIGMDKKAVAKALELQLFERGAKTYFLAFGNLLRSLSAESEIERIERSEQVRRMGEIAHLFMDAGLIVIATATNLSEQELRILQEVSDPEHSYLIAVGESRLEPALIHLQLDAAAAAGHNAREIADLLAARNIFS